MTDQPAAPAALDLAATPLIGLDELEFIADGVDHAEGICVTLDGILYVSGEAGQVYRVADDGTATEVATTGGWTLGLAADAAGRIYACDPKEHCVWRLDPDGLASGGLHGRTARPATGNPELGRVRPRRHVLLLGFRWLEGARRHDPRGSPGRRDGGLDTRVDRLPQRSRGLARRPRAVGTGEHARSPRPVRDPARRDGRASRGARRAAGNRPGRDRLCHGRFGGDRLLPARRRPPLARRSRRAGAGARPGRHGAGRSDQLRLPRAGPGDASPSRISAAGTSPDFACPACRACHSSTRQTSNSGCETQEGSMDG